MQGNTHAQFASHRPLHPGMSVSSHAPLHLHAPHCPLLPPRPAPPEVALGWPLGPSVAGHERRWAQGPVATTSGTALGWGRGQQRCWAVAAPDSGGGCGSWIPTPVTEGGAEAVPPGVWDTARPTHQPHSSSNESPGSGSSRWPRVGRRLRWADGSGGRSATPATPPQTRGGAGSRPLRVQKIIRGEGVLSAPEGSAAPGGQLRQPLVSHRPLTRTLPCPSLAGGSALGSPRRISPLPESGA